MPTLMEYDLLDAAHDTIMRAMEVGGASITARELAARSGLHEVYLSQVRHNYDRMFGLEAARRISESMLLRPSERSYWFDQVAWWHDRRRNLAQPTVKNSEEVFLSDVPTILNLHHQALHGGIPAESRKNYHAAYRSGTALISALSPDKYPIQFLEILFVLNDIASTQGRHLYAYQLARGTQRLLDRLDDRLFPDMVQRLRFMRANSFHAEIVALNHLGLYREAIDVATSDTLRDAIRACPDALDPHILRARLKAASRRPRVALRDVKSLHRAAIASIERGTVTRPELSKALLDVELAGAYMSHGKPKQALTLLRDMEPHRFFAIGGGALHATVLSICRAKTSYALRDAEGCYYWLGLARSMALQADLPDQMAGIDELETRIRSSQGGHGQ